MSEAGCKATDLGPDIPLLVASRALGELDAMRSKPAHSYERFEAREHGGVKAYLAYLEGYEAGRRAA